MAWAISRRLTFWSLILGCGPGQVNEDRLPAIGEIQGSQLYGSVDAEDSLSWAFR
jgi:hypothetical protein